MSTSDPCSRCSHAPSCCVPVPWLRFTDWSERPKIEMTSIFPPKKTMQCAMAFSSCFHPWSCNSADVTYIHPFSSMEWMGWINELKSKYRSINDFSTSTSLSDSFIHVVHGNLLSMVPRFQYNLQPIVYSNLLFPEKTCHHHMFRNLLDI